MFTWNPVGEALENFDVGRSVWAPHWRQTKPTMAESPSRATFLSASTRTNRPWPQSWAASSASFKAIRSTSFQPSTYSDPYHHHYLVLAPMSGKAIMLQYIPHLVVFWHWSQDGALSPTLGGLKAGSPTILPLHQSLQLLHPLAQAFYLGFHRKWLSSSIWRKSCSSALPAQSSSCSSWEAWDASPRIFLPRLPPPAAAAAALGGRHCPHPHFQTQL